ncbi:hypothetical protein NKG94_32690 [Micromonospora sp. M12]
MTWLTTPLSSRIFWKPEAVASSFSTCSCRPGRFSEPSGFLASGS